MKKLYLIGILMLVILSLTFTSVYAITATVNLNGDGNVQPGTTNKISVSIASNDTIGGIEGKLVTSSNIAEILEENLSGKNGWTVTYNAEDGILNAFKARGTNEEEMFEIEYTVENEEGTAKIELKDLTVTDINYDEEQIGDISKTISIAKKSEEQKEGEKEEQKEDQKEEQEQKENKNNTQNVVINPDNTPSTKTETKNISTKEATTSSKTSSLPYTGIVNVILPIVVIGIIVGLCSYVGYKKYRGIK